MTWMFGQTLRAALVAGLLLINSPARAGDDSPQVSSSSLEQCTSSHFAVQKDRRSGLLLEARHALLMCLEPACPEVLRRECEGWQAELNAEIPRVVLKITDANSNNLAAAKITLDDVPLSGSPGLPVEVNPGRHELYVEVDEFAPHKETFDIATGERLRTISVILEPLAKVQEREEGPAQLDPPPRILWPIGVLSVSSAVFLGTGVALGVHARHTERTYETSCAPSCTDRQVTQLKTTYALTNVSLAVGAAAGVSAIVLWVWGPRKKTRLTPVALDIQPNQVGLSYRSTF